MNRHGMIVDMDAVHAENDSHSRITRACTAHAAPQVGPVKNAFNERPPAGRKCLSRSLYPDLAAPWCTDASYPPRVCFLGIVALQRMCI